MLLDRLLQLPLALADEIVFVRPGLEAIDVLRPICGWHCFILVCRPTKSARSAPVGTAPLRRASILHGIGPHNHADFAKKVVLGAMSRSKH